MRRMHPRGGEGNFAPFAFQAGGWLGIAMRTPQLSCPNVFGRLSQYFCPATHFRMHAGDVVPIGGLQVQHRNAFLQIMPSDGGAVDAVIAMGLTFSLE